MDNKIYLASPYTVGDREQNVRVQIDCADQLMSLGYVPFAPLLSHYHEIVHARSYEDWINWSKSWVGVCDAVLRLPGESSGAEGEVALAKALGIPVYFSVEELCAKMPS